MKKKKVIVIIIVSILILSGIGGFFLIQPPKLNAENISRIEFISLPSPPKRKIITQKEDIQKIVASFNNLTLSPNISISKPFGTQVWINTFGNNQTYEITINGSIVQINALSYKCKENVSTEMRELYQSIDCPEENYP